MRMDGDFIGCAVERKYLSSPHQVLLSLTRRVPRTGAVFVAGRGLGALAVGGGVIRPSSTGEPLFPQMFQLRD